MEPKFRDWTAKISPGKLLSGLLECLSGLLFSHIILRGMMPFGVACAAVGSSFGFVGAFVGYLIAGKDPLRMLTACFMTRVFRSFCGSLTEINRPLAQGIFALWGTMLGGLAGFFFSDYTPKENAAFMLGGLLSGGLAWMFSAARSAYAPPAYGTPALRYLCCTVTLTAALGGLMGLGTLWAGAAQAGILFCLFCVGDRCSYFYAVTTAAIPCVILFLFYPGKAYFFLSVFFGTLLIAAFRFLRRYGAPAAFAVSFVLLWFLSGRQIDLWRELLRLSVASLGYLVLPGKRLAQLATVIPSATPGTRFRRFRIAIPKEGKSEREPTRTGVCRECPKRILCRTLFRSETEEAFRALRLSAAGKPRDLPSEFASRCGRIPELLAALRKDRKTVFCLRYAKAFSQKRGEWFCGDTASGFRTEDDRYVFTVTDGMGSGTIAARQSAKASRMMEALTRNGLSEEDVIKVINRTFVDGQVETVVGVDVATVDLKNGNCELFKAGAAPTYLLRNGISYEVGSETLPVGILENTDIFRSRCSLADGDFLLLISDGVLGGDRQWLGEFLNRSSPPPDCVALAESVLREARNRGKDRKDDVTVLAVQIERTAA